MFYFRVVVAYCIIVLHYCVALLYCIIVWYHCVALLYCISVWYHCAASLRCYYAVVLLYCIIVLHYWFIVLLLLCCIVVLYHSLCWTNLIRLSYTIDVVRCRLVMKITAQNGSQCSHGCNFAKNDDDLIYEGTN